MFKDCVCIKIYLSIDNQMMDVKIDFESWREISLGGVQLPVGYPRQGGDLLLPGVYCKYLKKNEDMKCHF